MSRGREGAVRGSGVGTRTPSWVTAPPRSPLQKRQLALRLQLAPWHGTADDAPARGADRQSTAWSVPLATVTAVGDRCGVLWALPSSAEVLADTVIELAPLGEVARGTWRTLLGLLPMHLPVLTGAPAMRAPVPLRAVWVGRQRITRMDTADIVVPSAVDGHSLAGALAVAQCAQLLRLAPPVDLAVCLALNGDHAVEVNGLSEKFAVLWQEAPGVRRIAVSAAQLSEASSIANDLAAGGAEAFEIIGVSRLPDLLEVAFPNLAERALAALLAEAAGTSDDRSMAASPSADSETVLDALLTVVLDTERWLRRWAPIERAADDLAVRLAGRLSPAAQQLFAFVATIAARHEGRERPLPALDAETLGTLPDPDRLGLTAQFVQQAHDAESMSLDEGLALADWVLAGTPRAAHYAPHFRLRGARARLARLQTIMKPDSNGRIVALTALLGEQRIILDGLQKSIRRGWCGASERSYPLAEGFLLASLLPHQTTEEPMTWLEHAWRLGHDDIDASSNAFVRLARLRARVVHGIPDAEALSSWFDTPAVPVHVRASALRWRARWELRDHASEDAACTPSAQTLHSMVTSDAPWLAPFALLADIDHWHASGAPGQSQPALAQRLRALAEMRGLFGFGRVIAGLSDHDAIDRFRVAFPY